jgi:hypothetical protein
MGWKLFSRTTVLWNHRIEKETHHVKPNTPPHRLIVKPEKMPLVSTCYIVPVKQTQHQPRSINPSWICLSKKHDLKKKLKDAPIKIAI